MRSSLTFAAGVLVGIGLWFVAAILGAAAAGYAPDFQLEHEHLRDYTTTEDWQGSR